MDTNTIEQKITALEVKIDAVHTSVERTRKYMQIVAWVTIAMIVLPAIGLVLIVPMFINSYLGSFEGLV